MEIQIGAEITRERVSLFNQIANPEHFLQQPWRKIAASAAGIKAAGGGMIAAQTEGPCRPPTHTLRAVRAQTRRRIIRVRGPPPPVVVSPPAAPSMKAAAHASTPWSSAAAHTYKWPFGRQCFESDNAIPAVETLLLLAQMDFAVAKIALTRPRAHALGVKWQSSGASGWVSEWCNNNNTLAVFIVSVMMPTLKCQRDSRWM